MTYFRTSDFEVGKPEELRRDLQQMDRNIDAAIRDISLPALDRVVRKVSSAASAQFGEILVVDTSDASVVITLPQISISRQAHTGRSIGLLRSSLVNTLTLQCVGTDLINAAATYTVAAAYGLFQVIFDGADYWVR